MKILILNWRDIAHPLSGGAEISLFEHAKYWRKKNNDIIWFSSQFSGAKKEEIIDGITVIRKGSHFTVHLWAMWYFFTKKFPESDIIVDSFHFVPFLTPLYIKKREKIVGLINEVAGKLWFSNLIAPLAAIGYFIEPFLIRLYKENKFIVGSDSGKKDLITVGIPEKNITVVHHGFHLISVPQSVKKKQAPTVLFLGRIAKDKGITDVLKAFVLLKRHTPDAVLWVVGKEEKKGMLAELLETVDSTIKKDIIYWGFLSQVEKFKLLKEAWVLIHPSYKEGWGLTVIEAASQGTPTVGYNVAGLQDSVKNGETGLLVAPKNISLLSEAIVSLLKDKKKYDLISKNALTWSKNFTWEKSVKKSWDIINHIYENNKKP